MTAQAQAFPPACPHGPVTGIADDVFMVHGSFRMNPLVRVSRNMIVLRQERALTLVNPVRLDEAGLAELDALGRVEALLRLGSMHGLDEPFYRARYDCELWRQPGGDSYPAPPPDRVLEEGGPLPVDGARLFCFRRVRQPESALLLEREGLLLTCDAIQHYGDYSNCSLAARWLMPLIGFPRTTIVGPFWLKLMTPEGETLEDEFTRLLTLEFDALVAAHGTLLASGAQAAARGAVARAFPH